MLMDIALPKMRGLLVMTMASISTSGREVPPEKLLRLRAKVLLPNFCLETAALCPKVLSLFFLGQNDLYTRRWAPKVGRAGHKDGGRAQGVGRALHPCGWLVAPLWYFLRPIFFIYSKKILRKVSGHLELCRIGISDLLLSGP